ncbi:hypothetical protein [Brevundimonas variabilis]|uniref:hypothetical protein n=1 Tax=Brevundimonas variabilis TaxID=74312 RepID=UPI0016069947|nr:hypothetical protein [Brevundimonas variabilis]
MIIFMIGTPVAIAAVLAVVALSGRMPPAQREAIVRGAALVFYPVCVFAAAYGVWTAFVAGDGLSLVLSAVTAVAMAVAGIQIWRNPSLRRDGGKDAG